MTVELDDPATYFAPKHAAPSVIDDFVANASDKSFNDFVKDTTAEDVGASTTRDVIIPSVVI